MTSKSRVGSILMITVAFLLLGAMAANAGEKVKTTEATGKASFGGAWDDGENWYWITDAAGDEHLVKTSKPNQQKYLENSANCDYDVRVIYKSIHRHLIFVIPVK